MAMAIQQAMQQQGDLAAMAAAMTPGGAQGSGMQGGPKASASAKNRTCQTPGSLQVKLLQKESTYHSIRKEPLGKSYSRGHPMPEITKSPTFQFGKSSETANMNARGGGIL